MMKGNDTHLLSKRASALMQSRYCSLGAGFALVLLIAAADYLTGNELRLSVFYLAPILFVTWTIGRLSGILMSVFSTLMEFASDVMAGLSYSNSLILYWNAGIEALSFVVVVVITSVLKDAYERERLSARKDFLTGIANRQEFVDVAGREIERCRRYNHPLSVAYIDCDNFKELNDTLGHREGDRVLQMVGMTLAKHTRATDIAARLGGDEFAVFMPETGAEDAETILNKIRSVLLETMEQHQFPVTFSIGIASFPQPPHSVEEMLHKADEVMYSVKIGPKNMIRCEAMQQEECGGRTISDRERV